MQTGLGLIRDLMAAGLGLAILFGVSFSDDQVAGILLFVTTLGAFGTWAVNAYLTHRTGKNLDAEIAEMDDPGMGAN